MPGPAPESSSISLRATGRTASQSFICHSACRYPSSRPSIPARDALSKATLTALAALDGTAQARPFRSGWPDEGANPAPNPDAEPGNPLYGQTVVFTGQLGIPRPEAKTRSAEMGARPESRVTARTSVLVVGDGFDARDLRSGRLTGKAKRVLELHDRGQPIEVLSEGEFLQMVGGAPGATYSSGATKLPPERPCPPSLAA